MLKKCLDYTMTWLLTIGCMALMAMVLLTAADVGMRYFFNSPITASYELSEILMGIMSPIAILYCAYKNEHVCVDILFDCMGPAAQRASLLFANIVVLSCAVLLAWQSWYLILELREFNLASPTLNIPMWPLGCVFMLTFLLYIPVAILSMRSNKKGGAA